MMRLTEQGWSALEQAIGLVPRLQAVLVDVEQIISQVRDVVAAVEMTRARAGDVVAHTNQVVESADALVTAAVLITARGECLVDAYEPVLEALRPTVDTLAKSISAQEAAALVELVDLMPQLVKHLDEDVVPMLNTMSSVAPDLRDLLDVSREFNELLGSLPGLGRVKKRIDEQQRDDDNEARN